MESWSVGGEKADSIYGERNVEDFKGSENLQRLVGCGMGDGPEGKSISRAEKRLERAQGETGGEGDGAEEGAGGHHWGGTPMSRAGFGAQDIG